MNRPVLVLAVLEEAWKVFGPFTEANQEQVTQWVTRRVRELTRESETKAAAS